MEQYLLDDTYWVELDTVCDCKLYVKRVNDLAGEHLCSMCVCTADRGRHRRGSSLLVALWRP